VGVIAGLFFDVIVAELADQDSDTADGQLKATILNYAGSSLMRESASNWSRLTHA